MALSFGGNKSKQKQSSKQYVLKQQLPFLENLWGQAQDVAVPTAAGQLLAQLTPGIGQGLQGAFNTMSGLTDPQAQIDAQSASLQSGLGQLFREQINPAIESNAISAGGLGGGRQGVAQGVATGQLANAFTQGYGDIVSRANQQSLTAGAMLPGMGQAMTDNALAPQMGQFEPLAMLAQILGSPTVLTKSSGSQKGSGFNFGL